MTDNSAFTDDQLKAIDKVTKLMALAAGNANEHEAAVATDMASAILAKLNLSMVDLKQSGGKDSSQRKDDRMVGGFYQHERDMWKAISELNFCVYTTVKVHYDAEKAKKENRKYAHHHRLIGRTVNILASKLMADYLLQTLERLTKEYCEEERPYEKFHPRSSTAVSFRKGAAERLIEKINDKRREVLREERRKEAEQKAAASHPSASPSGTALVVTGLIKSEAAGNYDFIHGEGAYAKREADHAQWIAKWEKQEEEAAKLHAHRMANDPEYKKAHEKRQRDEERKANRRTGRSYSEPQFKGDATAFRAGYRTADGVGLDKQVDHTKQGRLK